MRRQSRLVWIGIVAVAAMAAISLGFMHKDHRQLNERIPSTCSHDGQLRTFKQWRQTVTFPYTGPEAKLRRVKDNYGQVEVGSSKEKVLNAFGPPDFEDELAPKEPNRPCVGYEFMYYFQKPDETNHELKDKRIDVF